jgi:hypothetical protein
MGEKNIRSIFKKEQVKKGITHVQNGISAEDGEEPQGPIHRRQSPNGLLASNVVAIFAGYL